MSKALELRPRRNENSGNSGKISGMDQDEVHPEDSRVELVASTGDITLQNDIRSSLSPSPSPPLFNERNDGLRGYFETAHWTADGTTILTSSSSNLISGYIVPEDLLSPSAKHPLPLTPQASIQLPEPSAVLSSAPYFHLSSPWTQQLLVSARDHPIQLLYLSPSASSHTPASAAYPLTKQRSETFLTATSLVWPNPGTHFIAGTRSLLAKYDLSRPNSEPVLRVKTIPSERHLSKGNGIGMRGAISSLAAQPPDASNASLVAAGTWTRWVGLYDFAGADGSCAATWSVGRAADSSDGEDGASIGGDGVMQTLWSPCGRYLLVSERKAAGILVYDVRVTGKLLGWLAGREARSNQRMTADAFPGGGGRAGFEVWAGTTGGAVKVWEGVGGREGAHEPAWGWEAARRSTVGSACVHLSGAVVATCSGAWEFPDDDDDDDDDDKEEEDGSLSRSGRSSADSGSDVSGAEAPWMRRRNKESCLKIWSISNNEQDEEDEESQRREQDEVEQ
ncbi:uncharacterized protein F4807DRAFT_107985 [Annulohypoxylon truncatum]|uniref:uncharacterized protein n=1 Tax=Annulohypoxylon truncatum TaxID=327061 RepID=UPI0020086511|nr:uncharacterized protein F4807DRAFT_107985 [Annulohypoxylon truncatum]KAI1209028.1 hypothetical protein F4807DRAFT_107985 [Annulohypoxylon truncatum]